MPTPSTKARQRPWGTTAWSTRTRARHRTPPAATAATGRRTIPALQNTHGDMSADCPRVARFTHRQAQQRGTLDIGQHAKTSWSRITPGSNTRERCSDQPNRQPQKQDFIASVHGCAGATVAAAELGSLQAWRLQLRDRSPRERDPTRRCRSPPAVATASASGRGESQICAQAEHARGSTRKERDAHYYFTCSCII